MTICLLILLFKCVIICEVMLGGAVRVGEPFGLPPAGSGLRERPEASGLPYHDHVRYRPKGREGRWEVSCNAVATTRQFIPGGEKLPKNPPTSRESRSWRVRGAKNAIFGRKTGLSWAGFRCLFGRKAIVLVANRLRQRLPGAIHPGCALDKPIAQGQSFKEGTQTAGAH